jgi:beta-1,4-N-acetylglucosaminyltransferase
MKLLVTVGTTAFDTLIAEVDRLCAQEASWDVVSQIGPGEFAPVHHRWSRYFDDLFSSNPDRLVVCHCGAGTVYELLDSQRPFIAVPNLERDDKHQRELARFLEANRLAPVAWSPSELQALLARAPSLFDDRAPYRRVPFHQAETIRTIIENA